MLQAMAPQESTSSDIERIENKLFRTLHQDNDDEACRIIAEYHDKFTLYTLELALVISIRHKCNSFTRMLFDRYGDKIDTAYLTLATWEAVQSENNCILSLLVDTPALFNRFPSWLLKSVFNVAYKKGNTTAQEIIRKAQLRQKSYSCAMQ